MLQVRREVDELKWKGRKRTQKKEALNCKQIKSTSPSPSPIGSRNLLLIKSSAEKVEQRVVKFEIRNKSNQRGRSQSGRKERKVGEAQKKLNSVKLEKWKRTRNSTKKMDPRQRSPSGVPSTNTTTTTGAAAGTTTTTQNADKPTVLEGICKLF